VEIDARVRLAGGTHQRQGAEDVAASHQRHDHGRADPELGDQARLLLAAGHAGERDLVRLGHHLGVASASTRASALGELPRQRALLELQGRRLECGIDVRDDESADLAAVLDEVDLAPVGSVPATSRPDWPVVVS